MEKNKGSFLRSGYRSGLRPNSKRYIGALARIGMLRNDGGFRRQEKRHIGAAFRSGWLPTTSAFRPVRGGRFSRSGRARSRIVGN